MIIERLLRQVDETGIERLEVRRHLLQFPLGGDLTANLHELGQKSPQAVRLEKMLGTQLRHTRPFFLMGDHQSLVVVLNGFIRQLHCSLNLSKDSTLWRSLDNRYWARCTAKGYLAKSSSATHFEGKMLGFSLLCWPGLRFRAYIPLFDLAGLWQVFATVLLTPNPINCTPWNCTT